MTHKTCQNIALSSFAVVLLTLAGVAGCAEEDEKVIQRLVSWPSDSGPSPSGFYLTYLAPDSSEELLFFHGFDGSRLLLTTKVDPAHGTFVRTLRDDVTGWWIRLGIELEATGDTLHEFFQNVYAEEDLLQELWLETSSGLQVRVGGPAHGGPSVSQVILRELEDRGAVAELSQSVPRPLRHSILFLAGSLADVAGAVEPGVISGRAEDPLLEILASVLAREGQAAPPATPMVLEELQIGAETVSARRDELLRRFESLPPEVRTLMVEPAPTP